MSETPKTEIKPQRLIPHHFAFESTGKRGQALHKLNQAQADGAPKSQLDSLRTAYKEAREAEIAQAPDLDGLIRKELKDLGMEDKIEDGKNYALAEIILIQEKARTAQDLRKVIKNSNDPSELVRASAEYDKLKRKIDGDIMLYGPSFEKEYRKYIQGKLRYVKFKSTRSEIRKLRGQLSNPAFDRSLDENEENIDSRERARLEDISRTSTDTDINAESILDSIKSIYPEGSEEYIRLSKEILESSSETVSLSKANIKDKITTLEEESELLWSDGMVQYFWEQEKWDKILSDFSKGKDVIETKSTIKYLNLLYEWEIQHPNTTVGGVLVGPPGVGKTTLVKHYLELRHRNYVYIDLSEDVTRYLLYGSKAIDFKSPVEQYEALADRIESMTEEDFVSFVSENSKSVGNVLGLKDQNDQSAVLISQIQDMLQNGEEVIGSDRVSSLKSKVENIAQKAFRKELGGEFAHLIKKNGWRDGVIIAALRRGDSIIMDEFNKNKNWSLIYGLLTAKPGTDWYFADNDETIHIPKDWRMYFTANIGRSHGVFEVAEALASRAEGKVLKVEYPEKREEMDVALAALSDAEGNFLRSNEDLASLYYTVGAEDGLFDKVRKYLKDKQKSIPISYRTIRDLGEKLVLYKDSKSGKLVYRATNKTFDEALYDVLIESYGLYESTDIATEIIRYGTQNGLFLDPSVKDKVIAFIGEEEYNTNKEANSKNRKNWMDVVNKLKGGPDAPETAGLAAAGYEVDF